MDSNIISTIITAVVTLGICLFTQHAQNEKTRALLEYKVDELIRKQDKYNSVIERTFKLEEHVSDIDAFLSDINRRIT